MTVWNNLILKLNKILHFRDHKRYISKLADNIEKQKSEDNILPFKLTGICENGFKIKVGGLFGYISFNHMPWKYVNKEAWKFIFPYLNGKVLFGRIYEFKKNPLKIILNGEFPQFRKPDLIISGTYTGIVINKTAFGVFVELGYYFKWKCGSIVGLMHASSFENIESFETTAAGQLIEAYYGGLNDRNQLVLGKKEFIDQWYSGEADIYFAETVEVKVLKSVEKKTCLIAENKFDAVIPVTSVIYPDNKKQISRALKNLANGDIIHGKVISINKLKKHMILKWENQEEINTIFSRIYNSATAKNRTDEIRNTIQNIADEEIVHKLKLVGKTAQITVVKQEDKFGRLKNHYLVENKYEGKIHVTHDTYRISKKETKQIEKNLENGELIECEITGIEKKIFLITWILKDEFMFNFITESMHGTNDYSKI